MNTKPQTVEELNDLQRVMANAVMRPLLPGARQNPRWIDGTPSAKVIASFIKPNDRLTSFERLQVYNRQYWFRLMGCFYEDYPGLRAVLGERKFSRLAQDYLSEFPSVSFTLRNLGQFLVRFIESHPGQFVPHQQLALDMARLEWAHIEAFDNAAEPPITADQLLDVNPRTLRLRLQPHLTLLRLDYWLDDFLISVRRGRGLRREASNAVADRHRPLPATMRRLPPAKPSFLAVHRHQNVVFYKRLRRDQFVLLAGLQEGIPLAKAIARAAGADNVSGFQPANITRWFQDWAALGWFCRGRVKQNHKGNHFAPPSGKFVASRTELARQIVSGVGK